jgi:hypothetical protein
MRTARNPAFPFELDQDGLIASISDFWPEPYEPPAERAHLAERF